MLSAGVVPLEARKGTVPKPGSFTSGAALRNFETNSHAICLKIALLVAPPPIAAPPAIGSVSD